MDKEVDKLSKEITEKSKKINGLDVLAGATAVAGSAILISRWRVTDLALTIAVAVSTAHIYLRLVK